MYHYNERDVANIINTWMSVNDVVALKNVREQTVTQACRSDKLRAVNIGKQWFIDPESVVEWTPREAPRGYKMPRRATVRTE